MNKRERALAVSRAEWIIKQIAKWNAVPHTSWELAGGDNMLSSRQKAQEEKTTGPGCWPFNNIAFVNKLKNPITVKLMACP